MPLPAKRGLPASPPEKGSFPLDHFGDCQQPHIDYLACIKNANLKSSDCKPMMTTYLQCRMQNGLMAQEDLSHFQLGPSPTSTSTSTTTAPTQTQK